MIIVKEQILQGRAVMWETWTNEIAVEILAQPHKGPEMCLALGASDTGKTTFVFELAKRLAHSEAVAVVDSDIGQSRIGPPTTIGWTLINKLQKLDIRGVSFVGAVSPVGHLLQFIAATAKCVRQAAAVARITIIDTPGFVGEPAATSLWWAVQDIVQPTKILLLQRDDELKDVADGTRKFDSQLIFIKTPPDVPVKTMSQRQAYRRQKFEEYFRYSSIYRVSLRNVAIQSRINPAADMLINRVIALRDSKGADLAIGQVVSWDLEKNIAFIRAPAVDIDKVKCLIIGDISVEREYEGNGT
jgi:polynucleotide 5'-hydroxyl-kinase GRC3/NOL9